MRSAMPRNALFGLINWTRHDTKKVAIFGGFLIVAFLYNYYSTHNPPWYVDPQWRQCYDNTRRDPYMMTSGRSCLLERVCQALL